LEGEGSEAKLQVLTPQKELEGEGSEAKLQVLTPRNIKLGFLHPGFVSQIFDIIY
jgi:hypothetical protein